MLFAAQQYALLFLLVTAAWGYGRWALRRVDGSVLQGPLRHAVPLATGLGCVIVLLQLLGIAGALRILPVAGVAALGAVLAAFELRHWRWRQAFAAPRKAWRALPAASRLLLAATLLFAASTALRPLAPPREWDELMYHLPHASEWAATGRLTVNTWLRYPWFPYNFNLLYAAALVAGSDVLPHLVHALAGWCAALLLASWARLHVGLERALLAALLWLVLARDLFGNAYVDLGVALFVLLGVVGIERWRAERRGAWLLVCAFALGVATGSKYQALGLLPFFALALWGARPSPRLLGAAVLLFLLPCAWWYGRNFVLAGDPVAPLGGRIFGFSDWNAADYAGQMADIRSAAGLPNALLWPAALAILLPALRAGGGARVAAGFGAWALLVWAATSRYPRYLLPAYPVLALLAVLGWEQLLRWGARLLRLALTPSRWKVAAALLLVATVGAGASELLRGWRSIGATAGQRDAVLAGSVTGYRMWQYLREHPHARVYQFRLEDAIYYAPRPVFGDFFGPWRYEDYWNLDARALHDRLAREGFDAIVVHTTRAPWVASRPGFERFFAPEWQDGPIVLYSLRQGPLP